jgi:hypothetical protein
MNSQNAQIITFRPLRVAGQLVVKISYIFLQALTPLISVIKIRLSLQKVEAEADFKNLLFCPPRSRAGDNQP